MEMVFYQRIVLKTLENFQKQNFTKKGGDSLTKKGKPDFMAKRKKKTNKFQNKT